MPHGRGQVNRVEIGGRRDGTVEAYRLTVLQDAGAYPSMGAVLPFMTRTMASGVYAIPKIECNSQGGRHQHDADGGLPRRRTARGHRGHRAGHRPVRRGDRSRPGRGAAPEPRLRRPLPVHHADRRRRTTAATTRAPSIGPWRPPATTRCGPSRPLVARPATRCSSASASASTSRSPPAREQGRPNTPRCVVHVDGSATIYTGASAHGQGHSTAWAMIAHDLTGIPMDRVEVVAGDTDRVSEGTGTFGSRSLQLGGSAVMGATEAVVEKARSRGVRAARGRSRRRGARHRAGGVPRGRFALAHQVVGRDRSGGRHRVDGGRGPLEPAAGGEPALRVDGGDVPVRGPRGRGRGRHRDRAGRAATHRDLRRRRHACSTRSSSRASATAGSPRAWPRRCMEEVVYDADGNPQTGNFADYAIVERSRAAQLRPGADGDPEPRSTRSAPRGWGSPAPSDPPQRCRAPCSTP